MMRLDPPMPPTPYSIRKLGPQDAPLMVEMLDLFGRAFEEPDTFGSARPGPDYLKRLLASGTFLAIAALQDGEVIGGLTAYELPKYEQERSEIYIYDLAVAEEQRRQGVATAMIREAQRIGGERGAWVIFVQADQGDTAAVALYSKLGKSEEVLHFDLPVLQPSKL